VIAGVVAEALHATSAGPVAVFRFSAGCLVAALLLTVSLWSEHTPSVPSLKSAPATSTPVPSSSTSNIRAALDACFSDSRILLLAGVQCLFEGSMYTFVLAWVPTLRSAASLDPSGFTLPFGVIFACFMVCIMIGSGLYSSLPQPVHISASKALVVSMFGGAAAFGLTSALPGSPRLVSLGFLAFEVFCGLYFPW
jgi:MFS transporter, MFS domain-containing protein family, molybdate-anion transporter